MSRPKVNAVDRATFYISTLLENADRAKWLVTNLEQRGWTPTYDWTIGGDARHLTRTEIAQVGINELTGVYRSDVFVLLLPGGRGSHVELGAALAQRDITETKLVIVHSSNPDLLHDSGKICPFYYHPSIVTIVCPDDILGDNIVRLYNDWYQAGKKLAAPNPYLAQ